MKTDDFIKTDDFMKTDDFGKTDNVRGADMVNMSVGYKKFLLFLKNRGKLGNLYPENQ